MQTVNSLSGGKTSSYIAINYPADIEIFALCCIDCHNAGKNISKDMKQRVNDKLQKYVPEQPEFVATSEDPKILKVMFDLEQMIGREIIWVRGAGWEQMIKIKKAIPNIDQRFCTSILKMEPIFEYLFQHTDLPVKMRIGYRWDEMERANNFNEFFDFPYLSEYRPKHPKKLSNGKTLDDISIFYINRWKSLKWRVGEFPLIDNRISHDRIVEFWKTKNIDFPEDSNCLNCFWKQPQQLRRNFHTDNAIMQWAAITEDMIGHSFKKGLTMRKIEKLPEQLDFHFGGGSGCTAGFCTD